MASLLHRMTLGALVAVFLPACITLAWGQAAVGGTDTATPTANSGVPAVGAPSPATPAAPGTPAQPGLATGASQPTQPSASQGAAEQPGAEPQTGAQPTTEQAPLGPAVLSLQEMIDSGEVAQHLPNIIPALPRFGANLFAGTGGQQVSNVPVPPNYAIGPGDLINLRIWAQNREQLAQDFTVSAEGIVVFPQVGSVTVTGQTLGELRQSLSAVYARFYREPTVTVTLSDQRIVDVYVTGDANKPGRYSLAGMASVLGALYAAGGPSDIGSFRSIKITRLGRPPVTVDLYDYLLTGSREADQLLQPGDTIFIPPLRAEVGIAGTVRRQARYELKGDCSVKEAIEMAGGLKATAYSRMVQLWRPTPDHQWQLTTLNVADLAGADVKTMLRDGDVLIVKDILKESGNTVQVIGEVKRPGTYPATAGATIASVLAAAQGPTLKAHMQTGFVHKLTDSLDYRIEQFNLQDILTGVPGADMAVGPGDIVEVLSQGQVELPMTVEVSGAVRAPGTSVWDRDLRVSQLILRAGGLAEGAYSERADLLRLTPDRARLIIPVNLRAALAGDATADLVLARGDILQVQSRNQQLPEAQVHIEGFVRNPGHYARREAMRVSDLIFAAGGLLPGGGPAAQYTVGRFTGDPEAIDLRIEGDPGHYTVTPDLVLGDDDSVAVSGRGDFHATADMVRLEGQVRQSGGYILSGNGQQKPYTVWDLIQDGGGLLPDANPDGIVVYRARTSAITKSQAVDLTQVLNAVNRQAAMVAKVAEGINATMASSAQSGMPNGNVLSNASTVTIVLPPRQLTTAEWVEALPIDGASLLASNGTRGNLELQADDVVIVPKQVATVVVLGAVARSGALSYDASQSGNDYIELAGGLREDADTKHAVVVHANGSVTPFVARRKLKAGDVVVIPTTEIIRTVRTKPLWEDWFNSISQIATAFLLRSSTTSSTTN